MGIIVLNIHIGKLGVRLWLHISSKLAVDFYVGVTRIHHLLRAIYFGELKLVLLYSTPVAATKSKNASVLSLDESIKSNGTKLQSISAPVIVYNEMLTAPCTQKVVKASK